MSSKNLSSAALVLRNVLMHAKFELNMLPPYFVANGDLAKLFDLAQSMLPQGVKEFWCPESMWQDHIGEQKLNALVAKIQNDVFMPGSVAATVSHSFSIEKVIHPIDAALLTLEQKAILENWLETIPKLDVTCDFSGLFKKLFPSCGSEYVGKLQVIISSVSNYLFADQPFESPVLCFNPIIDQLLKDLDKLVPVSAQDSNVGAADSVTSDNQVAEKLEKKFTYYPEYLFVPEFDGDLYKLIGEQLYPFTLEGSKVELLVEVARRLQRKS